MIEKDACRYLTRDIEKQNPLPRILHKHMIQSFYTKSFYVTFISILVLDRLGLRRNANQALGLESRCQVQH